MCEMLAAWFPEAHPFAELASSAASLEEYGLGGFGWGVAWLDPSGSVVGRRGLGRYRDEGPSDNVLSKVASTRFLVHLRRPSRLSTVQMADTQPFLDDSRSAFCHNGFLERAEEMRHLYQGRLHGRADSEVGWQFFLDRRAAGAESGAALRAVDEAFGGNVNLGFLGADGELALYGHNPTNFMWRFRLGSGLLAATSLHSDDDSLFELVFPGATGRERLEQRTAIVLDGSEAAAA
ncbi:MAG: class II glutamine amidotransferase [Acidimicrobiales bacterium]